MTLNALWTVYHSWVLGGLVVTTTSYGRFNTPPNSRSSTTWARYYTLASLYGLAMFASWIVVTETPDIVNILANRADLATDLKSLEAPMYAAVLLTVLAGVSPFSMFDARVREFLQKLARIPWEAQRLSAALRARTWLPNGDFQDEIRKTLREAGFNGADVSFSSDRTPQALWTRITALQKYIELWQTRDGRFAGFYSANTKTIGDLKGEYGSVEEKARRVFLMLNASKSLSNDSSADSMQQELVASFVAAAEQLESKLCDVVSRGVLTCGLTARARRAEFETIGFMVNVTPTQMLDHLLGLYLCLSGFYVAVLIVVRRPQPLLTGIVIATNYVAAVVMALMCKRSEWSSNLPVAKLASSAGAAFAFSSFCSLGLGILLTFDVATAWESLVSRWWPWSLMSAVVAALVGYFIDQEQRPQINFREAGMAALACGCFAVPVVWLLNNTCGTSSCDAPPLLRVVVNAALTGAMIGFFVPTWYRRPEIMVSAYERFKVRVTTQAQPDGGAVATIDVFPPRLSGGLRPTAVRLPDEIESASVNDAIAEAIRTAREWIDEKRNNDATARGNVAAASDSLAMGSI